MHICCCYLVAKWCLTLCDLMDHSLPRSSVYGISQARILEWVAISFSRGSSQPRDWTCVNCIVRQNLYCWGPENPLHQYTLDTDKYCLISFIWGTKNSQIHRGRKYIGKFQEPEQRAWGVERNVGLVFNGDRASV